jgi:hypothetical protein
MTIWQSIEITMRDPSDILLIGWSASLSSRHQPSQGYAGVAPEAPAPHSIHDAPISLKLAIDESPAPA